MTVSRYWQFLLSSIALSLAPPCFANPSADSSATPGDVTLGTELFGEFCANCHGDDASGLATFSDDRSTFSERLDGITENMPDFAGVFEEDEISALFAYLNSTKAKP